MKTKQLMLGMMACVALLATSCDKDDENNGVSGKVPASATYLYYNGGKFTNGTKWEYTYDGQNRLTVCTNVDVDSTGAVIASETPSNQAFTYTGDKLTKMVNTYSSGGSYTYTAEYPSATQVKTIGVDSEGYTDTTLYTLDAAGKVVSRDGNKVRYTYGADDVLSKMEWFEHSDTEPNDVRTYTYDSKNGIYKNLNMPSWFLVAEYSENLQHNVVSSTQTYVYGSTTENYSYTHELEYDAEDYPVKITSKNKDGKVSYILTVAYK